MKLIRLSDKKLKELPHKELCKHFIKVMLFRVKVGSYLEKVEKQLFKYVK